MTATWLGQRPPSFPSAKPLETHCVLPGHNHPLVYGAGLHQSSSFWRCLPLLPEPPFSFSGSPRPQRAATAVPAFIFQPQGTEMSRPLPISASTQPCGESSHFRVQRGTARKGPDHHFQEILKECRLLPSTSHKDTASVTHRGQSPWLSPTRCSKKHGCLCVEEKSILF